MPTVKKGVAMPMAALGSTAAAAVVRCALAPDPERTRSLDGAGAVRSAARARQTAPEAGAVPKPSA